MDLTGEFLPGPAIRHLALELDEVRVRLRRVETENARRGMVARQEQFAPRCPHCALNGAVDLTRRTGAPDGSRGRLPA